MSRLAVLLRDRRRRAWAVFAVALAIGLVHWALAGIHAPHDYFDLRGMPWSDALHYHVAARDLLDGIAPRDNVGFPMAFRAIPAPGYVLWLALVYGWGLAVGGAILLQLCAHAWTCALVYRIGARLFGEAAGLIAAGTIALSRTHLDFARLILTETWSIALAALACWCVIRQPARPRLASLWVGLAATVRPVSIVLGPLLLWLAFRRRELRARALPWALVLLTGPLAMVAVCNGVRMGAFSPAATVHVWTVWSEFPPNPDSDDTRFAAFVPLYDQTERAQRETFAAETWHSLRARPLAFARSFYHNLESNFRIPLEQPLVVSNLIILPLFLIAVWGCLRARDRAAVALLAAFAFTFLVGTALGGQSTARFRLPVDWALTLLTVGGLVTMLRLELPEPAEPEPRPLSRAFRLGALALGLVALSVPLVRAAGQPAPVHATLDEPGVAPMSARDYVLGVFDHPETIDGRAVVFAGVIDALAHLPAGSSDPRSPLLAARPYGRTLAIFQIDDPHSPRVFLEIPDSLGANLRPGRRIRAVVRARIATNLANPSRERGLLVAEKIAELP